MNKQTPQEKTIQLNDGRLLGFAEYGDPNGTPVFYFHGTPGSRLEVARFHQIAANNQCRLFGIDRPGMGLSSFNQQQSLLSWATDVADFADHLGLKKFSIIGASGGAPFVATCAYAIPDRLNGAAIISGMAPLDYPEAQVGLSPGKKLANKLIKTMPWLANLMMQLTLMMLKKPKMMDKMIKQLPVVDQAIFSDPAVRQALINSTLEAFKQGIIGPANEMKLFSKPWGFDLENIKHSITIWYGTLDVQVPISHAKLYAGLVTGAQLKIIENEGHISLLDNYMEMILQSLR